MPGITAEVGKDEFFGTMAGYVRDVAAKSPNVGFCFSYPIEMFPSKDGRALYFSKEIKAPEAAGQMIGESLSQALVRLGVSQPKQFVLLNDTVATLLAGRAETSGRRFDSYIGFILGTGTNYRLRRAQRATSTRPRTSTPTRARSSTWSPAGSARPRAARSTRSSTPPRSVPASTPSRR